MHRKNLLVVDDEKDVLSVLSKGLTAEGYSVITASDGSEALALAKSKQPDLIILDVLLPDIDGPEVNRRLKEDAETKDIPIIFLTGIFPKREGDDRYHMAGEYVWFEKPYDILKLIAVIEGLLREGKALSAR